MNTEISTSTQAPILPQLAWVHEAGGPEIRSHEDCGDVVLEGIKFRWYLYGSLDLDLAHHLHDERGNHVGWISLERASGMKEGVKWRHYKAISRTPREDIPGLDNLVTIAAEGIEITFEAAVKIALEWDFKPEEKEGYTWYRIGANKWEAETLDGSLSVKMDDEIKSDPDHGQWFWHRRSERLSPLFALVHGYLMGRSTTRENAMQAAIDIVDRVLLCGGQLDIDHDAFQAGKAAGRAELLEEISKLGVKALC